MYKIKGATQATDTFIDVSYRQTQFWPAQVFGMANTVLLIGDDESGPAMALTALQPGEESEPAVAHMHGSDNFRTTLRGALTMGSETYNPGEFRFQDGWRMYGSEEILNGPDGHWMFIIMADRRGFRRRGVVGWDPETPEAKGEIAMQHYLAKTCEFDGDLVDADGHVRPGPAALQTTLGRQSNSGKLNGSFADQENWRAVSDATRAVVSVMGEPTSGPVLILADTKPHEVAMAGCSFDTELLRFVVAGSCSIDGRIYQEGDIRLQLPGKPCGPVAAGPDGLREILVLGDRRHAAPTFTDGAAWPAALGDIVQGLLEDLQARQSVTATLEDA